MERLMGIAASPGVGIGPAYLLDRRRLRVPKRHLGEDDVEREVERFAEAQRAADADLERIKRKLAERPGGEEHMNILEAHQMIVHDPHIADATVRTIRAERINAEWALQRTVREVKAFFEDIEDDYFRERRSDVEFVAERIMRCLTGQEEPAHAPPAGSVVVAHELSPADMAQLSRQGVAALATDEGAASSHTSIIARGLGIPAVVGIDGLSGRVAGGDTLVVDGKHGVVILSPSPEVVRIFERQARRQDAILRELGQEHDLSCETTDGLRIELLANVDLIEEADAAVEQGAEGIGLYRTEIVFMNRSDLPSEEEHYRHAREVLSRQGGRMVTFRTFDLGAEKIAGAVNLEGETNPALGLRSVRLCLRERGLFLDQLRGLLRAGAHGPMRLLLPLVSSTEEIDQVCDLIEEARRDLARRGLACGDPALGVMIETPAAAAIVDLLARRAAFFCLGTNDLIQYALAVDRASDHVSAYYRPLHPAILRTIAQVVAACRDAGRPLTMCGEMAADPLTAVVLVGLGLRSLSMSPSAVPRVKHVLRSTSAEEAEDVARECLAQASATDIERLVRARLHHRLEDISEEFLARTPPPQPAVPR